MFKRRPGKEFTVGDHLVRLKLFEAGVGWRPIGAEGGRVELFAWGLRRERKIERLGLRDEQVLAMDQEYFEWVVDEGCRCCQLKDKICSGLRAKPFRHPIGVMVNDYSATFTHQGFERWQFNEPSRLIRRKAKCRPRDW